MQHTDINELKKLLGMDKHRIVRDTIHSINDDTKLYQVLGYDLPLKYSTLKSKGIPDENILFVIERDEFRRELHEARERETAEKEAKERQKQGCKMPF